eukprot:NODE_13039_length_172_cov_11.097561_g12956_i0.p2 GENE.NODE_13039_length_172_cov_11.097561_g12956_i0~~NODE_13039_length_172_cov_11.097561_g12956_i0.p2  ORF type:complete len:54 (-),score=20.81 NODE_13039_length_172_cov_11.097561_g12956_i0:9-143(-)
MGENSENGGTLQAQDVVEYDVQHCARGKRAFNVKKVAAEHFRPY